MKKGGENKEQGEEGKERKGDRKVQRQIRANQSFPSGQVVKNPPANAGHMGWIPGP